MIKPIGGMLLVKENEVTDRKTSSGLVISAAFADVGPKSGVVIDMGDGEYNYKGDLIPINGIDITEISTLKPRRVITQAVIVVPIFAPIITPIAWRKVIACTFTKAIAIMITAEEESRRIVTINPVSMPVKRLLVNRSSTFFILSPLTSFK